MDLPCLSSLYLRASLFLDNALKLQFDKLRNNSFVIYCTVKCPLKRLKSMERLFWLLFEQCEGVSDPEGNAQASPSQNPLPPRSASKAASL